MKYLLEKQRKGSNKKIEGDRAGYHVTSKKVYSDFVKRWFSILIFLSLLLTLPMQAFSIIYGLVTDQRQKDGITNGSVVIVNLESKLAEGIIPVGIMPEGILLGGNFSAYIANKGSNSVSVIDTSTPATSIVDTITGSFDLPLNLAITPDKRYVLVTNTGMGNNYGITIIDTTINTVVMTIENPFSTFSPPGDIFIDANFAYVTYPGDHLVGILDISGLPTSYTEDWSVFTSPDLPEMIVASFSPDYIYVTTDNGLNDTVIQINPADKTFSSFDFNNFSDPNHLALHINGHDIYVTNEFDNTLTIIDTSIPQNPLFTRINVGISPSGIAFSPDGTYAYVVNSGEGTISIIDTNTKTVVDSISNPELITPVGIVIVEKINHPPSEPFNPFPQNGDTEVPISTILSWEGGDPDPGDIVTYDVFKGTDLVMDQICAGLQHPDTFCIPPPLEYGTTYHWKVVATDYFGDTSEVPYPYWSFTTEVSVPPCAVFIDPGSPTVRLGETLQFNASTLCDGISVTGEYFWDLTSSIGSTIDGNGLYTAGTTEGTDLVTVTDIANGDLTGNAPVTVVTSESPCEIAIIPSSTTVSSGETLTFSATTTPIPPNIACLESSYLWEIVTPIGSSLTQEGLYTAGTNDTGSDRLDVITVTDIANGGIVATAKVTVIAKEGEYLVKITPTEITLASLKQSQFTAQTFEAGTGTPLPEKESSYQWEIFPSSAIGSIIDGSGLYIAGLNFTDNLVTETVQVSDIAHNNASATATVTILVKYISAPHLLLPPGPSLTSYRMISVGPIWPIDGDALNILTGGRDYNPYLIRLFRWDGQFNDGLGGYSEYPDIPELEPGIGIWVITLTGGFIQVDGTPIDTSQAFAITLPPGWTQIGHPFPSAVDWSQVSITTTSENTKFTNQQTEVELPWAFEGTYLPSPFLLPWHGYFVYNNSVSPVTISIPPEGNMTETSKMQTLLSEEDGWQLQIGAQNILYFWLQDIYNYIGLSKGSTTERDSKDLHEPPPASSEQVSLYFPHEWEDKSERYTTDFRSLDSMNEVFQLTVNPGSSVISLIRLFWSDMAKVSEEYQMEFIDPETGIVINMREVNEYWFLSHLGREKHFTISLTKILPQL